MPFKHTISYIVWPPNVHSKCKFNFLYYRSESDRSQTITLAREDVKSLVSHTHWMAFSVPVAAISESFRFIIEAIHI